MSGQEVFGFRIGDRVVMQRPHSWAGETGTVTGFEPVAKAGTRPKVVLDNRQVAFIVFPQHARVMDGSRH